MMRRLSPALSTKLVEILEVQPISGFGSTLLAANAARRIE
jgi:hypothetical protein